MSEVLRHIPESVAHARPKEEQADLTYPDAKAAMAAFWNRGKQARRQTWADVEASAAFRQSIDEALEHKPRHDLRDTGVHVSPPCLLTQSPCVAVAYPKHGHDILLGREPLSDSARLTPPTGLSVPPRASGDQAWPKSSLALATAGRSQSEAGRAIVAPPFRQNLPPVAH
jgi:hypothetical protein